MNTRRKGLETGVILAVCLGAVLVVSGCRSALPGAVAGTGQRNGIWDIVPGKSAGPVKIGMKSIEVHQSLGVPTGSKSGMREVWMYKEDLAVAFDSDSRVTGVQLLRPGRAQWKGRWLDGDATGKDVVSIFGEPDFVSHWTRDNDDVVEHVLYGYRALGFGVLTDPKTDRVVGYIVTVPEGASSGEPRGSGSGSEPPPVPVPPPSP